MLCISFFSKYSDCLGPDTPEDLRQLAIDDNLKLLAERPEGFSQSDLTTLIHHCRKRKWPLQIDTILNFISERIGISSSIEVPIAPYALRPPPMSYNDGSYSLSKSLYALTWIIYAAALDAYFSMNLADSAFLLYKNILHDCDEDSPTKKSLEQPEALIFILKGFFKCGRADYAVFVFDCSIAPPSYTAIMGLMHGLGNDVLVALRILSDVFKASCYSSDGIVQTLIANENYKNRPELDQETPPFSLQSCKSFLVTLLESCAILGNIEGFQTILSVSLAGGSKPSCTTLLLRDLMESEDCTFISACLMACVSEGNATIAHNHLLRWQSPPCSYLPPYLFLHSLIAESFSQTTTTISQAFVASGIKSLPFKGFARVGNVRHLDKKRAFLRNTVPKCKIEKEEGSYFKTAGIFDIFTPLSGHLSVSSSDSDSIHIKNNQHENTGFNVLRHVSDECLITTDINNEDNVSIELNEESMQDNNVYIAQKDSKICYSTAAVERSKKLEEEEDILFTHYLLVSIGLRVRTVELDEIAEGNMESVRKVSAVAGVLLLQHLETRLLRVRDKISKILLQKHILHSFSVAMQIVRATGKEK